ncbi:hypothetical protein HELRODRAFT_68290, partial [Helobdella robusta]|uniref:CLIP1 zinc knuckle domain-containing protein n=1 Tax=Helobdella robusta TaxID=6412 RepID=T1FZC7_HELRO
QVDFLNSVIVDIQKKNDDLQKKLSAALSLEIWSVAPHHSFSQISTSPSQQQDAGKVTTPTTLRFFCDICDVFDLHDTDDCPKQCGLTEDDFDAEGNPASKYHGDPSLERPYCEICEVFGHTTEECQDDQTF